jgi:hypothetical protein
MKTHRARNRLRERPEAPLNRVAVHRHRILSINGTVARRAEVTGRGGAGAIRLRGSGGRLESAQVDVKPIGTASIVASEPPE